MVDFSRTFLPQQLIRKRKVRLQLSGKGAAHLQSGCADGRITPFAWIFGELASHLGVPVTWIHASDVFDELAAEIPAFSGSATKPSDTPAKWCRFRSGSRGNQHESCLDQPDQDCGYAFLGDEHSFAHDLVERKQSAVMQDRIGANRANIGPFRFIGLFQIIADSIKMLLKEDFIPKGGNKFLHTLAPMISFSFAMMAFTVIPIGNSIVINGHTIPLVVLSTNVAILFVFAMLSLEIYGVVFAGYSNDNYSMLGGLRRSAQMFSYEITFGATVVGLLMIFGTMNVQELVIRQQGSLFGFSQMGDLFTTVGVPSVLRRRTRGNQTQSFRFARRRIRDRGLFC